MKKSASFLVPLAPILLIAIIIAVAACSKSGNGSKPKLSLESINSPIQQNESLLAKLKFTNGGNLSTGILTTIRIRTNEIPPSNNTTLPGDTINTPIPQYTNAEKGEMEYTQPYQGYLHFGDHLNDTLIFKFALITANGVSSDTITSGKVVVINP